MQTKRNGVRPSRATTYRQSRTRKDGSIVNAFAAEVVDKLQCISDTSSGTSTQMGVIDWTNDELAKIKGREKGGRVRCLGKVVIAKGEGSCSTQDQVPILKARINELEDEMKEMEERRAAEMKEMEERQAAKMKEMKSTQDAMFRFMCIMKEQLPNIELSNIFNEVNMEVANDSCSAFEHRPNENPTSSRASQNHIGSRNKRKH